VIHEEEEQETRAACIVLDHRAQDVHAPRPALCPRLPGAGRLEDPAVREVQHMQARQGPQLEVDRQGTLMTKRRCLLRADPKGNRSKGRCLRFARPAAQKVSDAKKVFNLGEYAKRRRARRKKPRPTARSR
jgi:hypothetical protein